MLKGDIDAALVAHIKWLVIFKNHLSGIERDQLDPEIVGDDRVCNFGQWLHANKAALPFPEQFEYIQALHAIFHLAASEMAAAAKTTQNHNEIKRQINELQNLSNQLIAALSEVRVSLFPVKRQTIPRLDRKAASRLS